MYLIPAPAKLEKKEGRFIWAYDRYVTVDQSCSQLVTRQASLFCDGAEKELGYRPLLTRGAAKAGDVVFKQDDTMKAQSYVLDITEDAIVLTGDEAGLWHGMQTLLQIIEQEGACLSALHIEDAPAIVNRGYYFDCTRGRIPKLSWLKQLADRMAYYKLNQLQLYVEHSYLFRGMTELWRDDTPLQKRSWSLIVTVQSAASSLYRPCQALDTFTSCFAPENTLIYASWRIPKENPSPRPAEWHTTQSTHPIRRVCS